MSQDDFYTPPAQPPTKKQLCNAILALREVHQSLHDAKLRANRFVDADYKHEQTLGFVQVTCDRHTLQENVADLEAEAFAIEGWCLNLIEGYENSSHGQLTQEEEHLAQKLIFLVRSSLS